MTLPYDRKFNVGRGSEQIFNEEMHRIYESIKHLLDKPEGSTSQPTDARLNGSLWLDMVKNELNYYDKDSNEFKNVFANKFKIVDEMTNDLPPADPVLGQLWLNNGCLMYFDGATWQPIKALVDDGTQINLAAFEDFLLISPLAETGNAVVDDAYRKAILEGKLDWPNDAQFVEFDDPEPSGPITIADPTANPDIPEDVMSQYLVPNMNVDRFYIDGILTTDYKKISPVCIQYPKKSMVDKTPSVVHVNPGKVTEVRKRLIKIDKANTKIQVSAFNTEFYGFYKDKLTGRLLRPSETQDVGDYITVPDGIVLNYNAGQDFDYVLAVTYKFSWIKSTGRLSVTSSKDITTSYYISNYGGPVNVFVDGYDLENKSWDIDDLSDVVNIKEETKNMDVSIMRSAKREYGYIRDRDINGRGIIKTLESYIRPMVFVNGEALHPTLGDYEIDGQLIYVNGARDNMTWCVMELDDIIRHDDMFYAADSVKDTDASGNPVIKFDNTIIAPDDDVVLYVNGLLVKKEDVVRNETDGTVTANGLELGMEYILLKDKYHNLYDETALQPAMAVGRADETLVYMNGRLLCNDTAFVTVNTKAEEALIAANGEIKLFLASSLDRTVGEWCIWDSYNKTWNPLGGVDVVGVKYMGYSYDNTLRAIKINVPYTIDDLFNVYAFNFANSIDNPLTVRSVWANDEDTFAISNAFVPNVGSLSVWLDGVRQYYVDEFIDGTGFKLPKKYTGKVTYCVENPPKGQARACDRIILGPSDVVPGAINVYKTDVPLYPGRVTVYIAGLRVPKECWTILDNYTILFKDQTKMLIGNPHNYPNEPVQKPDGNYSTFPVQIYDEIMIEIRQEFQRVEQTVEWTDLNNWDIDCRRYDLPLELLEAADEIMVFVNGLYTGLRNDIGYRKDRARGCLTILSGSVVNAICTDPLYTFLMTDQVARLRYQDQHNGQNYVPKINNKITLEWR